MNIYCEPCDATQVVRYALTQSLFFLLLLSFCTMNLCMHACVHMHTGHPCIMKMMNNNWIQSSWSQPSFNSFASQFCTFFLQTFFTYVGCGNTYTYSARGSFSAQKTLCMSVCMHACCVMILSSKGKPHMCTRTFCTRSPVSCANTGKKKFFFEPNQSRIATFYYTYCTRSRDVRSLFL